MKKIALLIAALFALQLTPAHASTPVVRIVDKPHINFDGQFRDDDLATSLLPNGKLGKLVFPINLSKRTFVIDPRLVDEVVAMSNGYSVGGKDKPEGKNVAANWLLRLKYSTVNNQVVSLAYGNPDEKLLKAIAPSELKVYAKYGKAHLEAVLGRAVLSQNGWGTGTSRLGYQFRKSYTENRRMLVGLSTISESREISDLRARLAIVMNPLLNLNDRAYFSYGAIAATKKVSSKLRVTPGRYQITSESVKLPITLINSFETASVVNVSLIPMNSRIQIQNIQNVTLAPKSRQQLTVTVNVNAPGSTLVLAQLMNAKGNQVGEISKLNFTATIIDSRVAWFTAGAALLLFLAAIAQSVRRIRRSRHEK